jgi:hypothetical protein
MILAILFLSSMVFYASRHPVVGTILMLVSVLGFMLGGGA